MSESIQVLTDENFAQTLEGSALPVLVDFWAPWCGPCRLVAPVLEELSGEMAERLSFAKINVDENQDSPTKYKIRSIPCLIVFRSGQEIGRVIGHKGKKDLVRELDNILLS
jgi:thioredoxin 1